MRTGRIRLRRNPFSGKSAPDPKKFGREIQIQKHAKTEISE
ncbi:MAG TPA: hypothetical protein VEC06_06820 [Paucimonas sp.]|nr:hypothetical protein [Paucimonas sp.]